MVRNFSVTLRFSMFSRPHERVLFLIVSKASKDNYESYRHIKTLKNRIYGGPGHGHGGTGNWEQMDKENRFTPTITPSHLKKSQIQLQSKLKISASRLARRLSNLSSRNKIRLIHLHRRGRSPNPRGRRLLRGSMEVLTKDRLLSNLKRGG